MKSEAFKKLATFFETGEGLDRRGITSTGTGAAGGFALPEEIDGVILDQLRNISPIRQIAQVVSTTSSDYKKLIGVGGVGTTWNAESTDRSAETASPQMAEVAPTHGELWAKPEISQWALDDLVAQPEAWLQQNVSDEFAKVEGAAFVAGDGTNKPTGFLAGPTPVTTADGARAFGTLQYVPSGAAGAFVAASASVSPADCLINMIYTLKAGYRANAKWVMNSQTAGTVRKFKDLEGRFLWTDPLAEGQPPLLLGYPVIIAEDLPDIAANWGDIKTSIGNAITSITGLWDTFVGKLQGAVQAAKDAGKAIADALSVGGDGVARGPGSGGPTRGDVAKGTLIPGSYSDGAAGADGLVNGFVTQINARMGEITAAANGITRAVKDSWQVASPSRVFAEIGGFLSEGLAVGIREKKPMVDQAMDELGDGIEGKADSLASKLESFKSTFQNAFVGLVTGANSFKEAIGQIASQLAQMAANAAFEQLFGNLFKGGGLLGGLFGFADGGAFAGGRVMAFANGGIVNGATAFGMQGGLGVMGEAGPEAIMPLARGRGGKLGVVAQGGGSSRMDLHIHENPMFAARVEGIADGRAVAVTRSYDREVAPQSRTRNPRERG